MLKYYLVLKHLFKVEGLWSASCHWNTSFHQSMISNYVYLPWIFCVGLIQLHPDSSSPFLYRRDDLRTKVFFIQSVQLDLIFNCRWLLHTSLDSVLKPVLWVVHVLAENLAESIFTLAELAEKLKDLIKPIAEYKVIQ